MGPVAREWRLNPTFPIDQASSRDRTQAGWPVQVKTAFLTVFRAHLTALGRRRDGSSTVRNHVVWRVGAVPRPSEACVFSLSLFHGLAPVAKCLCPCRGTHIAIAGRVQKLVPGAAAPASEGTPYYNLEDDYLPSEGEPEKQIG